MFFGTVLRRTTRQLSFTLRNPGNLPVSNITAVIGGSGTGYSFDASTLPSTLSPGESKVLTVAFTPPNASAGGQATLNVSGTWGMFARGTGRQLHLNGTGTSSGYQVAPGTLDFGGFAFDSPPQQTFQIGNIGDDAISVQSANFTPDAGTGPLEFARVIRRAGAAVTLPAALAPGELLDVTVTAVPSHRTGLMSGHIDVHTSIAGVDDQRVVLTGNAQAAVLAAPALVDFGSVDLHGEAPSRTVMIRNTGTAPLAIASVGAAAGSSTAFQATLPAAAVQLVPGASLSIPVAYRPTVAQPAGEFEAITLVASIAGTLSGASEATTVVRGRGIDRHLEVAATPTFPPSYRYPGAGAPNRPVTVRNTGEAPLVISAVMLAGAPVWRLVDSAPVTISGGASHDFVIAFAPTAVGPAPAGQLTLTDDDTAEPMATIALTGDGVARSVAFDGPTVDVGTTAPGPPVQAALMIRNLDTARAVTVRDVVVDDEVFSVTGAAGTQIAAGASSTYTVRFTPRAVGAFHAQATLCLDEDPDPQATVALTGQGSAMAASGGNGGGGCSTGSGSAGGAAVLAAMALLARRRPRAGRAAYG